MAKGIDAQNLTKWFVGILPLLALLVSLGITWGISKAGIEEAKAAIVKLDTKQTELDKTVVQIQIRESREEEILNRIMIDVQDIKANLKELKTHK